MLLPDLATLQRFVASADFNSLDKIEPSLLDVESDYLLPVLGADLHAALELEATTPTPGSVRARLLLAAQRPLAQLAFALALPQLQTTVSETGVQILSTATHKTAFQWQIADQQRDLRRKGLSAIGQLIEQLEASTDALAVAWRASTAGQAHRQELFTRVDDFIRFIPLPGGREVFVQFLADMRRAESFDLVLATGLPLLQELRTQVRTRSLSSENQTLLEDYVWPALASLTIARALASSVATVSASGGEITAARIDTSNEKEGEGGSELITQRALAARLDGNRYLQQLRVYLNAEASPSRFATYYASSAYTAPAPPAEPRAAGATARFC